MRAQACVKVSVEPARTWCVRVCACVWFLAGASEAIGLPVGSVCWESGEASGRLNNSTFLQLE